MEKKDDLAGIERIIGYHFFEPQHLIRALTHPAYANELIQKNRICLTQEAYSTLGDAVLKTSLIPVFNGKRHPGQGHDHAGQRAAGE